ncbi:hypothetical protein DBB34_00455 [Sphaerisporangium cinnabarinum]|nr:hypothetical protein DBB34_00455 [Sphaerisporangium cinnabarinum]
MAAAAAEEGYEGLAAEEKLTISTLTAGFGLLARRLERLESDPAAHERSTGQFPRFAGRTTMQEFPFFHKRPFLDLDEESRINIRALLIETTSRIASSQVAEARNSLLHANREPLDPVVIADALDDTHKALKRLEGAGLYPKPYAFDRFESELWGRGVAVLTTLDTDEYRILTPSRYEWLGLPRTSVPQFIFRLATFGDGGQALRFREGFDSRYEEYWSRFPLRREAGSVVGAERSDSLSSPVQTGSHVESRAD